MCADGRGVFPPAWPQRRRSEEHELVAGAAALLRHHHHGRRQADVPGSQSGAGCRIGFPQGPVFTEPLRRATGVTREKPLGRYLGFFFFGGWF